MIGGALVGTFLGVFLAYGFVGPFSVKVRDVAEEDAHFYRLIREVLIANMHNHSANMCIEVGRQNAPLRNRPSFSDLEKALKKVKQDAA
jgi:chemotaxis protein MotA